MNVMSSEVASEAVEVDLRVRNVDLALVLNTGSGGHESDSEARGGHDVFPF